MKRRLPHLLLSLSGGLAAFGALPTALPLARAADLSQVYQQALRNDPQLREAEANRLAALEAKPQALANLLPQLSAGANYSKDKNAGSQVVFDGSAFSSRASSSELSSKGWSLSLRHNLFRWENWATLQQAHAQVAQAEAD